MFDISGIEFVLIVQHKANKNAYGEGMHNADILKAVDYVLPRQKSTNKAAVKRAAELSEIFTQVTNPQWQNLYWKSGAEKLRKIQKLNVPPLYLPEDPLDLEEEFVITKHVLNTFMGSL